MTCQRWISCRAESPRSRGAQGATAAFTLLEAALAITLTTVVAGSIYSVVFGYEQLFSSQVREHTIDEAGWRVCDFISQELRCVDPSTVLPLTISNSATITYQKITGFQGGAPTLGPSTNLRLELATGESANGLDDNGDGRVDESFLLLTEGAGPGWRVQGNLLRLRFDSTQSGIAFTVAVGLSNRGGSVRTKTFNQEITFRTAP